MEKDTLYSRWLRNELTEAEKNELKASGEWDILEKIVLETDTWELPPMKEKSFNHLKEKTFASTDTNTNVVPINRRTWIYSVAASIAIFAFVGYWFFLRTDTIVYESFEGQSLKVVLPDTTEVTLTGHSSIEFAENQARAIRLKGRAYFSVKRKGRFTVSYEHGEVTVLGTRFDILAGKDVTVVKCFEGKVAVKSEHEPSEILTAGMGLRTQYGVTSTEKFSFTSEEPEWIDGESSFKEAPLAEILDALSVQYNIEFDFGDIDTNRKYTGKFVHSDLDKSLEMVFLPMGITYKSEASSHEKKRKVILKEN